MKYHFFPQSEAVCVSECIITNLIRVCCILPCWNRGLWTRLLEKLKILFQCWCSVKPFGSQMCHF